jgi:hypothetical protein
LVRGSPSRPPWLCLVSSERACEVCMLTCT